MSIREYQSERVIVWPSYFVGTRKTGRRTKRKEVNVEKIVKAAERLGLDPLVIDKKYPRNVNDSKAVVVKKIGTKSATLRKIVESIE